jgi:aminoglycoside phosphotransferase (APT) family kinase protein
MTTMPALLMAHRGTMGEAPTLISPTMRRPARALDAAKAARLIAAQFPEVRAASVEPLGEGCDFRAFLVDERWVFRFPKSAEGTAMLRPEIALLAALAPQLPLPVPCYRFVGTPCAAFALPFAGYAQLPGVPAMQLSLSPRAQASAAKVLGAFLTCLHRQDIAQAAAFGVPDGANPGRMTRLRDEALANLAATQSVLPAGIAARCRRFLQDRAHLPKEHLPAPRLIHADLTADHVLIDPFRKTITGIIDWTDIRIDDIAFDFAGLWHWQGDHGVETALRHYIGATDRHLRDRIRFIGLWKALTDIRYGCEAGDPAYVDFSIRCLARMFGGASGRATRAGLRPSAKGRHSRKH